MSAGDTETVTVVRKPPKNAYGDRVDGDTEEFDIHGCLFAPGQTQEPGFAAHTVEADGAVYTPPGIAEVLPTDMIRIRGDVYSVVGRPQVWGNAGVVIRVKFVTG